MLCTVPATYRSGQLGIPWLVTSPRGGGADDLNWALLVCDRDPAGGHILQTYIETLSPQSR